MSALLGRWVDYYCQARHDGHGRYRAARWATEVLWVLRR
jgi:hypothetical protein